jgi:hypothetical protein
MKRWLSFFEIPARDFERAVSFYERVFEAALERCQCAEERMAFFPKDESGLYGAVIGCEGYAPSRDGVIISFAISEGISPFLERVREAGGKVLLDRTKIQAEKAGFCALFSDSEGNRIGLHSED